MMTARARRRARADGKAIALAGSVVLHGALVAVVFVRPVELQKPVLPVYKVELLAAPVPEPSARRAPEAVAREVERPAPVVNRTPPKRTTPAPKPAPAPPRQQPKATEPAPRQTSQAVPDSTAKPSTGSDIATIKTAGVDFLYPEYLENIVTQIYRYWQKPEGNAALEAEILFLIRRDGSVSNLQFIKRSGNYVFDLEAKGAIEAAAAAKAFGELPQGFPADVLPVSFFFQPASIR